MEIKVNVKLNTKVVYESKDYKDIIRLDENAKCVIAQQLAAELVKNMDYFEINETDVTPPGYFPPIKEYECRIFIYKNKIKR